MIPSGPKLQVLENFQMTSICSRQLTPSHGTTPQVVRKIKDGIILMNVTNTLQECGTGAIPKDKTGQITISGKV